MGASSRSGLAQAADPTPTSDPFAVYNKSRAPKPTKTTTGVNVQNSNRRNGNSQVNTDLQAQTAAAGRSNVVWSLTGSGGVAVIPYIRSDKKALFVDFESRNFKDVDHVYYKLNYESDEPMSKRGVEGSFFPAISTYQGYHKRVPYIRRELVFGTCSKGVCTYHNNPRDMTLTVRTKYLKGKVLEFTKVFKFTNNQLR